ncbi:MAG: DUF423 domain-containing protein [Salegentibacter sp.]
MQRRFLVTGAVLGLLAVIIGAFAAHGLKPLLDRAAIESFETGVRYQMYHALLLLFLGGFGLLSAKGEKIIFYLLLAGVILFSGSIYALSTNSLTPVDFRKIALLTPLGGTLMIIAWTYIVVEFYKLKKK